MARTPQGGHKPLTPEQRAAREAKRERRQEEAEVRAARRRAQPRPRRFVVRAERPEGMFGTTLLLALLVGR